MKKITFTALIIVGLFSCTKNNINDPLNEDISIVKIETIDMSLHENNLSTAINPAQYNLSQTQKVTYSNGLITYTSSGIIDKTKYFQRFTKDNIKFVEAIATDSASIYGVGYRYYVLRSLTGLRYHSCNIRLKDMALNDGVVERELPLYTLVKPVFLPIGTPGGETETPGKLFSCLKSRLTHCGGSWRCTTTCLTSSLSAVACLTMQVISCMM